MREKVEAIERAPDTFPPTGPFGPDLPLVLFLLPPLLESQQWLPCIRKHFELNDKVKKELLAISARQKKMTTHM